MSLTATRLAEIELTPADRIGARPTLVVRRGVLPCAPETLLDATVLYPYGDWADRVGERILTAGSVTLGGTEYGFIAMSVVLAAADGGEVGGRTGALAHSVVITASPAVFVSAWQHGAFANEVTLCDWFPVLTRLPGPIATLPPPRDDEASFTEELVRMVRAVSGQRVALLMPANTVEGELLVLAYLARGSVKTARSPGIEAGDPCELIVVPSGLWSGLPVREGRTLVG